MEWNRMLPEFFPNEADSRQGKGSVSVFCGVETTVGGELDFTAEARSSLSNSKRPPYFVLNSAYSASPR